MNRKNIKKRFLDILESELAEGVIVRACNVAGVSRETIYKWMREDNAFKEEVEAAQYAGKTLLVDKAWHQLHIKVARGNVKAIIFVLKTLRPEQWGH